MPNATARIVVQTTPQEKKRIAAKAKRLALPVAELMRRGASAYASDEDDAGLAALAEQARSAALRSAAAIDAALAFIQASNRRMAQADARAAGRSSRRAA